MNCSACGHENRPGAKFCEECATPFKRSCGGCGSELRPSAKFCDECGAPVAGSAAGARAAEPTGARKVVTIIFADLVGSTSLHERLDAEAVRQFMDSYYVAMRGAVEAHGGRVTQVMGDGVKAVLGAPRVAEDDAIRAVRAAVQMQQAFRQLAVQQSGRVGRTGLRVAVNTGEVVAEEGQEIIGDPVNVAARLQEQGKDGDVVIGGSTQRLVASLVTLDRLGSFALKGRSEQVEAYLVRSLDPPAAATTAPFVGRAEELARLQAVYDEAVAGPAARLAVLVGSPGLGKSRLIAEFSRRAGEASTVVSAHCDAAGGATFAPLAEALRELLGIEAGATPESLRAAVEDALPAEHDDRDRIASGITAMLSGSPSSPEETFFVVRRMLGALAAHRPVVLVIDDLQWAEPLLLDLVEHLVQWSSGVPLLVLVGARPELRDLRSSLVTPGGLVGDVVTLAGLDAGAATQLAANVIGASDLPAAVAAKVLATSEGNPLFVGELVRMLVQEGALTKEGERWKAGAGLASLEMPPTIHALLAARIERLRPLECSVLECAAVVGRHFSRNGVAALLPQAGGDLDACLEALRRAELIEPDTGWFLGEPVLRFHHVLIRDAAYRRLLKGTRADLHARLADWIEARAGDAVEHDEIIGWHFEQAHRFLCELGPIDDENGKVLGERAAQRLAAAGRRALARDDVPVAANLLGRALGRLAEEDAARGELALDWCEALLAAGDVATAKIAIEELGRFSKRETDAAPEPGAARLDAWHTCFTGQLTVLTAPQELQPTADAVAAAAQEFAALGDAAGEAKAHSVHAQALARLGRVGAAEAALDRALAAARQAGDRRRANAVLAGAPLAALWGPSPVTRASGRCLDVVRVLRITQGSPAVEAVALSCQGELEALRGRTDAARRMIASSREMVEELGITHRLFEVDVFAGRVDLLEGDAAAAERRLRGAYEGLRDLGLGIDAARAGALLARAMLAQGQVAEAEKLSHESEALAGDELQAGIAWRGVRAEALARRGEHAAAVELAQAAVALAAATDALLDHADARLALAAALRAAGRVGEADAEERRAVELWEAKGASLLAERARHLQAGEAIGSTAPGAPQQTVDAATRRRVRANAATAMQARFDAALSERDFDAVKALFSEDCEVIDHPNAAVYGRAEALASLQDLFRGQDPSYYKEALATLGESLSLNRRWIGAGAAGGKRFDVGAYELESITLAEVDERGLVRRHEYFGVDHLGDALVRLYERHAELLSSRPESERAATRARSIAALMEIELDRLESVCAAAIEVVDHRNVGFGSLRGSRALVDAIRAMLELTDSFDLRVDDVLGVSDDAVLVHQTSFGTARASGGPFERTICELWVFGADGSLERWERFDTDHEAEALSRFDALTRPAASPVVRRRVDANAATAANARVVTALAARDFDDYRALFSEEYEEIHHPTGAAYGLAANVVSMQRLFRSQGASYQSESLATLGVSLNLVRRRLGASATGVGRFDVGEYETELISLTEVDERGLLYRHQNFAAHRLGDALARLYERYAELLPLGPERDRAAATARSLAALVETFDLDRLASLISPAIEVVDHRSVIGFGSLRGSEAFLGAVRALLELTDGFDWRFDDLLASSDRAILVRHSTFGTDRASGGAFERTILELLIFGADGLVERLESFDLDHEVEALARFDELAGRANEADALRPSSPREDDHVVEALTRSVAPPVVPRRVQANAATNTHDRIAPALTARNFDALLALFSEEYEEIHHPTGSTYGREETVASMQRLFRSQRAIYQSELMATLGPSLSLDRTRVGASATGGGRFDVGAYESEMLTVMEVDERGLFTHEEVFASDSLDDAITCLYERYAASLPEGAERRRAAATARSVATMGGPLDLDRFAPTLAPAVETIDHRSVGFGTLQGKPAAMEAVGALHDLCADLSTRCEDVLAAAPDALAFKVRSFGTLRAGGGEFDRVQCIVAIFGADGRVTRSEQFDSECYAEALARFDELTAARAPVRPARHIRANAATRNAERQEAAILARDTDALIATCSDQLEEIHHPTGATLGVSELAATWRGLFRARNLERRLTLLAALGESLALGRVTVSHAGVELRNVASTGAMEVDYVILHEVDENGLAVWSEVFAEDHFGDAITRFYERYAEGFPARSARERAGATARAVAGFARPFELDRFALALAPTFQSFDHRILGTWSASDAEAMVAHLASMLELATDVAFSIDDVLALEPHAFLLHVTHSGMAPEGGGLYERPYLLIGVFGSDGLAVRAEFFDVDQENQACSRFAELAEPASQTIIPSRPSSSPPSRPFDPAQDRRAEAFANTATRAVEHGATALAAHDWDGFRARFAAEFHNVDRRAQVQLEIGRDDWLSTSRERFEMTSSETTSRVLATRGERLALVLMHWQGEGGDVDPSAIDWLMVAEVDGRGHYTAFVYFDPDALDAAYEELEARYASGEAAAHPPVVAWLRDFGETLACRDWVALAKLQAPALVGHDQRLAGWGTLHGPAAFLEPLQAMIELAPDARTRSDHVRTSSRGFIADAVWVGTRDGGAFESPYICVVELDTQGLAERSDFYDPNHLDAALARFREVAASPGAESLLPSRASSRSFGRSQATRGEGFRNAATRGLERTVAALAARDFEAFAALHATDFKQFDRRPHAQLEVDRESWLAGFRQIVEMTSAAPTYEVLATRGERLALARVLWQGAEGDIGPSEIEILSISHFDAPGSCRAVVYFDPDGLDAAYAELDARWDAGEGAQHGAVATTFRAQLDAFMRRDWEAWVMTCAPDCRVVDHRILGWGTTLHDVGTLVRAQQALVGLASDVRYRTDHLRIFGPAILSHSAQVGTRVGGGAFETPFVWVSIHDRAGRYVKMDIYDLDQLAEAQARFDEATRSGPPDPLAVL